MRNETRPAGRIPGGKQINPGPQQCRVCREAGGCSGINAASRLLHTHPGYLLLLLEARSVAGVTCACLDLARARQRHSCHLRAGQLIDQHTEEDDVADQAAHLRAKRLCRDDHPQRQAARLYICRCTS